MSVNQLYTGSPVIFDVLIKRVSFGIGLAHLPLHIQRGRQCAFGRKIIAATHKIINLLLSRCLKSDKVVSAVDDFILLKSSYIGVKLRVFKRWAIAGFTVYKLDVWRQIIAVYTDIMVEYIHAVGYQEIQRAPGDRARLLHPLSNLDRFETG